MELGLTFPLQRFLKMKPPACGAASDRRFCWDLHVIRLRGRVCLLAVHCHSRYAFVRYDVPPLLWADLPELFLAGLRESLTAAGFAQEQISGYLRSAEAISITRTHGRREVAFLNRAWEEVLALDLCLDTAQQAQPLLDHAGPAGARALRDWARGWSGWPRWLPGKPEEVPFDPFARKKTARLSSPLRRLKTVPSLEQSVLFSPRTASAHARPPVSLVLSIEAMVQSR